MDQSRREFIKTAALGSAGVAIGGLAKGMTARSYNRIIGANERLQVAIAGLGRRLGAYYEPIALKSSNVELLYLCDVMQKQRESALQKFSKHIDYKPKLENDIRKVLADKDVDVLINATPDHWHAPGTWLAVQAGKHVYVEKPCSHNPREGEILSMLPKKYNKVIQMGNQQRSAVESIDLMKQIHSGAIGQPYKAVAFYIANRGAVPVPKAAPVPDGLDWELFQGPAPRQPYQHDTWDYNWHWYGWTYGTAEAGNNGTHELDVARWALQVEHPQQVSVEAAKRHFADDGWTMYDTMDATYRYAGDKIIKWECQCRNGYKTFGSDRGVIIYGTNGSAYVDRDGYRMYNREGKLTKERKAQGAEAGTALGGGGDMTTRHVVNFFEAIRGKEKQNSPIEEGAKSVLLCHLANIAYRANSDLAVDETNGHIKDKKAMKLWSRDYEKGWEPPVLT
ncbi:oxidoreductase domain protein [Fibrisoma limi BUZ 3]|uniref:Oxidoreductase domain protein n=1 Tax=Fibrisoma limi BUZ 3 TaxID=1185876 RepID=I2GJJ1_9BACT|nr:Gfo/Idh/MocA family oxidoreductase [Fibrisoma limi]CCH54066.1 oxidoreductase domain protein [Fibrisoma limi BUZ 3]